jgi:hypothetical protein
MIMSVVVVVVPMMIVIVMMRGIMTGFRARADMERSQS